MEMLNIGWEDGVRSDPEKKIVTLPKLGLFLGRKAQEAMTNGGRKGPPTV